MSPLCSRFCFCAPGKATFLHSLPSAVHEGLHAPSSPSPAAGPYKSSPWGRAGSGPPERKRNDGRIPSPASPAQNQVLNLRPLHLLADTTGGLQEPCPVLQCWWHGQDMGSG